MIVSFTGHRPQELGGFSIPNPQYNLITTNLRNALLEVKPDKAISGMALGFDTWAAEICLELNIPLICAIPFKNQESFWPQDSQTHYQDLLSKAESVVCVCDGEYAAWKMQKRNEYLVDNCDLLIAAWNGERKGGTYNCLEYARNVNRNIKFLEIELKK